MEVVAAEEIKVEPEIPTSPNVSELRARIINSVLNNGLKPASKLLREQTPHIPSNDADPYDMVEGWIIKPRRGLEKEQLFSRINNVLYTNRSFSILGVLTERFQDEYYALRLKYAEGRALAEGRMRSSFLVVYKFLGEPIDTKERVGWMEEEELKPENILYVVMPEDIYEDYQKSHLAQEVKAPIKVVGFKEAKLFGLKVNSMQVPDYEQALVEIAQEADDEVWVHGVKLPTQEDVEDMEDYLSRRVPGARYLPNQL